jgi:hypothetical protein
MELLDVTCWACTPFLPVVGDNLRSVVSSGNISCCAKFPKIWTDTVGWLVRKLKAEPVMSICRHPGHRAEGGRWGHLVSEDRKRD